VALFYNDYDDIRSTSPTPVTLLPLRIVNDLEGRTWGLEAAGTLQLTDEWTVSAGYNLLKERLHVEPGRIDYSAALNETADPQQQFSLRSALTLPRRVELDAALRWVDTLHNNSGPIAGTVPDYMELEARLAWHPTERLELALVGRNLLHDHHPEYGFPNPRRLEVERSVYGRLTWRQ
jgi:iron complex outermembrane receptor protein